MLIWPEVKVREAQWLNVKCDTLVKDKTAENTDKKKPTCYAKLNYSATIWIINLTLRKKTRQHIFFYSIPRCIPPPPTFKLTFQGHPVLLPLAAGHQLQLPVLVQGDKGFERKPASPSDHPLLLFKQLIQLLHGALGRLAAALPLFSASGRLSSLTASPSSLSSARLQLSHEVLVDILADGITGCLVNGSRWLGPGGSLEPDETGDLGRGAGVCSQAINPTVESIAQVLVPGLLMRHKKGVKRWEEPDNIIGGVGLVQRLPN